MKKAELKRHIWKLANRFQFDNSVDIKRKRKVTNAETRRNGLKL